ncbi:MAG: hypothetical protein ACRDK2_02170, partial [Solirubrobacteraceae bacterium]
RVVKPTFEDGDYLALDFESNLHNRAPSVMADYIEVLWRELKRRTVHDALIYGSTWFLEMNTARGWLRSRRRWQAAYGPAPGWGVWRRPWWAWQGTDGAVGMYPRKLAGIPAGDVSVLNLGSALVLNRRFSSRRRRVQHH